MTLPAVIITQIDGGLGVQAPAGGNLLAVVGPSSSGPLLVPSTYARPKDIQTAFGSGPLVEEGCLWAQRYGRPILAVRTASDTPGSYAAVVVTGVTGTSVPTAGAAVPVDDYDAYVKVVTGGTIGVAGITYQWSLDGGRTLSAVTALGVANSITIPNSGVQIALGAGTLIAGDVIQVSTSQPVSSAAHIANAMSALAASNVPWEFVQFATPLDGAAFDAIETSFAALFAAGKYRSWQGSFRRPNVGETEAAYKTAFDAAFGARTTIVGSVYAGDAKVASAVSGRLYRMRTIAAVGPLQASVSEEINIADIGLGPLSGVQISDDNGNPENHDESANPGLDDSRAGTLRSWSNRVGVFVTRPRILCPVGSDFTIVPYRRVMNLFLTTLFLYLQERLMKPIRVSKKTGLILESEAVEIEKGALARLRPVLLAKPKASGIQFGVSRADDLLATKTLTCDGGLIPLAYPETILLSAGFINPALQLVAV
jgi:hypothetical protein